MTTKTIRDRYIEESILLIGQRLNEEFEIIDRRSNYVVCVDSSGQEKKFFLEEAQAMVDGTTKTYEKIRFKNIPFDHLTYKNFVAKNIPRVIREAIEPVLESQEDQYATLQFVKNLDGFILSGDVHAYKKIMESQEKLGLNLDLSAYMVTSVYVPEVKNPVLESLKESLRTKIVADSGKSVKKSFKDI